jgi:glycine cleavage system aminomethyltransferase T
MEYNYALYQRLSEAGERFGAAEVGTYAINALRVEKVSDQFCCEQLEQDLCFVYL